MKTGKGGSPAFWDDVADAQAAVLRAELERVGIAADRLAVKGLAGSKGQNMNAVVAKLDQDLFPELATSDSPAKSDGKRGSPSPRARSPNPRGR